MSLREPGDNREPSSSPGGEQPFDEDLGPDKLRELLDRHVSQQLATARLSRLALRASFRDVLQAAAAGLRDGLQADGAEVLELVSGEVEFRVRFSVGLAASAPIDERDPAGANTIGGHALRHNEVLVVDDFDTQTRFERSQRLDHHGVTSSITARIPGIKRPFGILGAYSKHPASFSADDSEFIRTIANIIGECAERERSEQHRRRMYEELHRAMSTREEMLAIISHDLRSPASAIKLSLEVVRRAVADPDGPITAEQVERAIRKANSNVDRMMTMMDDLLAMSRAESDAFEIEWEDVDLREIVDEAVADYGRAIASSGSKVNVEGPESLIGHWDWMRIEQVVTNLLSNAIKYGEGNPITVELSTDEQSATLRVADRGRGIPKQHQKRIFERFVRINHRDDDQVAESYGLGLWIVKRIVEALHGSITVDSAPGEGTTFSVQLPRDPRTDAV